MDCLGVHGISTDCKPCANGPCVQAAKRRGDCGPEMMEAAHWVDAQAAQQKRIISVLLRGEGMLGFFIEKIREVACRLFSYMPGSLGSVSHLNANLRSFKRYVLDLKKEGKALSSEDVRLIRLRDSLKERVKTLQMKGVLLVNPSIGSGEQTIRVLASVILVHELGNKMDDATIRAVQTVFVEKPSACIEAVKTVAKMGLQLVPFVVCNRYQLGMPAQMGVMMGWNVVSNMICPYPLGPAATLGLVAGQIALASWLAPSPAAPQSPAQTQSSR